MNSPYMLQKIVMLGIRFVALWTLPSFSSVESEHMLRAIRLKSKSSIALSAFQSFSSVVSCLGTTLFLGKSTLAVKSLHMIPETTGVSKSFGTLRTFDSYASMDCFHVGFEAKFRPESFRTFLAM